MIHLLDKRFFGAFLGLALLLLVYGRNNRELEVQGHLQAVGTDAAPITFTSEINNDGNQWAGIYFNTGTGHLKHVVVRYGGDYYNAKYPTRVIIITTDKSTTYLLRALAAGAAGFILKNVSIEELVTTV